MVVILEGIKAEVDGLIIEGAEDAQDPPVLRAFHGTDSWVGFHPNLQENLWSQSSFTEILSNEVVW